MSQALQDTSVVQLLQSTDCPPLSLALYLCVCVCVVCVWRRHTVLNRPLARETENTSHLKETG